MFLFFFLYSNIQVFAVLESKFRFQNSYHLHNSSIEISKASAIFFTVDTLPSSLFSRSSIVLTGIPDNLDNAGLDNFLSSLISLSFNCKQLLFQSFYILHNLTFPNGIRTNVYAVFRIKPA